MKINKLGENMKINELPIRAYIKPECGLTKSVRRVFEYKAIGLTEAEIANLLYKSVSTINAQSSTYLNELGAKNTPEAVAKAAAQGWLTFKQITQTFLILFCIGGIVHNESDYARVRTQTRIIRIHKRGEHES